MTPRRTREKLALLALELSDIALERDAPKPTRKRRKPRKKTKFRKLDTRK